MQLLGLERRLLVEVDPAQNHASLFGGIRGQGAFEPQAGQEGSQQPGTRGLEEVAAGKLERGIHVKGSSMS
jgi:hypothetical protein